MKFGFVYGPFCLGGSDSAGKITGFDFSNIWGDSRGLTGSELSFIRISQELAKRGHEVHSFTFNRTGPMPVEWEGLCMHDFIELYSKIDDSFDAVCSWNEAEVFRRMYPKPLRLCNLQINDFVHCRPFFHEIVDVWTSPSESHRKMVFSKPAHPIHLFRDDPPYAFIPRDDQWTVITNGCDPDIYERTGAQKVPGRVIWASSPDRGLHWLLQEWPKIKKAVPGANLRIFYRVMKWADNIIAHPMGDPTIMEQVSRAYYIKEALRRLEGSGVELVDSVSRNQINKEMQEAEVVAYSCDPVSWTEGFSVTLMEACAAKSCPITTSVDALPEIYGGSVPMIPVPVKDHIGSFSDLVIQALTNSSYRAEVNQKVRELSFRYTWASIAERLEKILVERCDKKKRGIL